MSSTYSELHSREYGLFYEDCITKKNFDLNYLHFFNYDKFNYLFKFKNADLKVYQGFQGFSYLKNMDFILPQTSLFEEKNVFLSIFGIKTHMYKIFNQIVDIKRSEKILKNLLNVNNFFKKKVLVSEKMIVDKLSACEFKNNTIGFEKMVVLKSHYRFKGILAKQILNYYGDSNIARLSTTLNKRLKIEKDMFYNFMK